jgi:hypothetical protein
MSDYFDRDGTPITMQEWAWLFDDADYKRVARGELRFAADGATVNVSTVWIGLNHNWADGPPHIFETMIFGGPHDTRFWRWSSEEDARAGHDAVVAMLLGESSRGDAGGGGGEVGAVDGFVAGGGRVSAAGPHDDRADFG